MDTLTISVTMHAVAFITLAIEDIGTVGDNTKFTFCFCSTIILQCEKWCKFVVTLASRAPFLQVSSVVKFLTAYTRCNLCPTVFYLGCFRPWISLLGGLCLVSTVFTELEIQWQHDRQPTKPHPPSESSWN